MAYRYGNRKQMALLPKSIEEYVSDVKKFVGQLSTV